MIFTKTTTVPTTHDRRPCTLEGTGVHGSLPCALRETRVAATVSGFIAEVRVEHAFENPHAVDLDALYTFPLPHDAAVVDFEFLIDGRTVKGVVREREAARQDFEKARTAGQRAGLVEQHRPNVFELELANIPARGSVKSRITYLEALPYAGGEFELRFPTVVAPRYTPGGQSPDLPNGGEMPIRARAGHTIAMSLALDAGMPIESFRSDTHALIVTRTSENALTATLANGAELPDRDVVLRYKVGGAGIRLGVVTHRPDPAQDGTFYMFAVPPADVATGDVRAKEVVLLVDRSGSMSGAKMDKAREAVKAVLRGLNPADTFSIILFDDRLEEFDSGPVRVTDASLDRAERWLDQRDAKGGTEVLPAIVSALSPRSDPERQRIVVLITDGQVSNEAQVLAYVRQNLRAARLFTVGIDTAVNTYLLSKLARFGRGSAELVLPTGDIEGVIARLANRIGSPLLTDPVADFGTVRVSDLTPHPLPDVLAGQVVVVAGRYRGQGTTEVVFSGQGPGKLLEHRVEVTFPKDAVATPACEKVWARLMIDRLEEDLLDDPSSPTLKQKISALAMQHGMMSSQTSFVAIDEREGDPERRRRVLTERIATQLPAGWDADEWLGGSVTGAAPTVAGVSLDCLAMAPAPAAMRPCGDTAPASPARRAESKACAAPPPAGASRPESTGIFKKLVSKLTGSTPPPPPRTDAPGSDVERVLRQLAKRQSVNGSWNGSVVETALAIAAFVSHGHTDRTGDFTAQVRRAAEFLAASLASGWTAAPGSLEAVSVAFGLAWLVRATGSAAHQQLAERFARVGASAAGAHGAAVNLGSACRDVRAQARRAGVAADLLPLLNAN